MIYSRFLSAVDKLLHTMFTITFVGIIIACWVISYFWVFDVITTDGVPWDSTMQAIGAFGLVWVSVIMSGLGIRIVADLITEWNLWLSK
tara:strand:- start:641 stop:907 length:267 start_codon:yes stop_codon:yes gene_type:complete